MMEVPIDAFATPEADDEPPRRYPRRTRIPVLESWRGERVIYERLPGSKTLSVRGVQLNCAPRAESMTQTDQRVISAQAAQQAKPVLLDGQQAEFNCTKTSSSSIKLVVLPPFSGTVNPPTFVLPAFSLGHLFVIEGSLRFAVEGEEDKAVLNTGDHMLLPGSDREALFASAGARGASAGAKFKIFFVTDTNENTSDDVPPCIGSGLSLL